MRRTVLAAVVIAIASTFAATTQAQACVGLPCDVVNRFCHCLG